MKRPRITEIIAKVLGSSPEERNAFLEALCEGDEETFREATQTLAASEKRLSSLSKRLPGIGDILFDRFLICDLLGAGGMGVVYLVEDQKLPRKVALKLVGFLDHEDDAMDITAEEARLASGISSPYVAVVHDYVSVGRTSAIVMEYVSGQPLSSVLGGRPQAEREAVRLCSQIAEGMEAVHSSGVLHRDLKPDNVMVTDGGNIKIVDFGIGTAVGSDKNVPLAGTPSAMSPERLAGDVGDKASDVWSFGCILHECIFGTTYTPNGADGRLESVRNEALKRLLTKCLHRSPSRRPSFREILGDLRKLKDDSRRFPWRISLAIAAPVLFLFFLGQRLGPWNPPPPQPDTGDMTPATLQRVDTSTIQCYGSNPQKTLWIREFEGVVEDNMGPPRPRNNPKPKPFVLLPSRETWFCAVSVTSASLGNKLHLIDAVRNEVLWTREPDWIPPLRRSLDKPAYVWQDVARNATEDGPALVLSSRLTTYESGVELVSLANKPLGTYFHPGHLLFGAEIDVDCDGVDEICLYGNNGPASGMEEFIGHARSSAPFGAFIALDPKRIEGQGFPYSPTAGRGWPDIAPAEEDIYMIIPPVSSDSESASIEYCTFEDGIAVLHTYDNQIFYVDFCSLEIRRDDQKESWNLADPPVVGRPRLVVHTPQPSGRTLGAEKL